MVYSSATLYMQVQRVLVVLVLAPVVIAASAKNSGSTVPVSAIRPNVVLITLDTTRADRMGFLGSKRGLTPNLDALAAQSVVFTRAYAQVPLTTPSHAALLTGTYPQFNRVEVLSDALRDDIPYLPDLLRQQGYRTAAFVGSMILDPASGAPGFDRGFDVYDSGFHLAAPGEDRYLSVERRAEDVAKRALGWIRGNRQEPFFVWMHFYDPHEPYDPPEPFKARYESDPYDGEIAYTDSVVGSVMKFLKEGALFENCAIAVVADHGEAFGEHGERRHGLLLYDETIHVPLLLKLPMGKFAGRRIDTRVALAEVAPALLEVANITAPATMQAHSFFPLIEMSKMEGENIDGPKPLDRTVYSESDYAHRTLGWSELRAWRGGKYLYIQAPRKELYDQSSDPGALNDIAPGARAVVDTLNAQLSNFWEKTMPGSAEQVRLDPAQAERLHALGYMASDGRKEDRIDKPLVDPKDKVEVANLLQEAIIALAKGHYDDAMAKISKVIRDPDADNAYLEFGTELVRHKRYQDAAPLLRKAVEKLPDSAGAHYELGIALVNTGQWDAALPQMQAAVTLKPDSASLHFNLAAVNTRLKHLPEAMAECEKALEIDPDHFDANLTYGKLLLMQGHPELAITSLSHAVKVKPASAEAHFFLGQGYQKLGDTESANREREIVRDLSAQTHKQ
jgi:arylsulfatase A-like enzyme/Flp pilus assembly protein TadD